MIVITIINKILEYIKKNYKILNLIFLILSIYVILFPIISIPIKTLFPMFGQCTYLRITGNSCPLCGGTRYIQNLPQALNDITYLFNPFGIIIVFIVFEIVYRIINLTIKKQKSNRYILIDILIHIIAIISFITYEIVFLYRYK